MCKAAASSASATPPIAKREKPWLNVARNVVAYATTGTSMIRTPTVNFSKSLRTEAILPSAAVLRKSLISKMLAEATDIMIKKGIRMVDGEVNGLTKDKADKANGTGT